MKKLMGILLVIAITVGLIGCGFSDTSEMPEYEAIVICEQEGYTSPYSYGIYYSTHDSAGYDLVIFGMHFGVIIKNCYTIFNPDGTFETPIYEQYREKRVEESRKLISILSENALKEIVEMGDCWYIRLEDATYTLIYNREESGDYLCYLFKYTGPEDIQYTSFKAEFNVIINTGMISKIAAYEDNTICICDTLWFNKDLEQVDKQPIYNPDDYLMPKDTIISCLKNSGIEELQAIAEDAVIQEKGRIGDTNYCFIKADGVYLIEIDMQGNILRAVRLKGLTSGGWTIIPKIQDDETKEYYDVIH